MTQECTKKTKTGYIPDCLHFLPNNVCVADTNYKCGYKSKKETQIYVGTLSEEPKNPYILISTCQEVFDEGVAARDAQMKEVDVHKMANFVYGHLPANKEPKLRDIEQTIQDFIKQEGQ